MRGGEHTVGADEREAVGRVADAARGRQADAVAGAARKIDAHDAVAGPARCVARRIGRPEHGDDGRADGSREMHRAGVAGDAAGRGARESPQRQQIEVAGDVDDALRAAASRVTRSTSGAIGGDPVSTIVAPAVCDQASRDFARTAPGATA